MEVLMKEIHRAFSSKLAQKKIRLQISFHQRALIQGTYIGNNNIILKTSKNILFSFFPCDAIVMILKQTIVKSHQPPLQNY